MATSRFHTCRAAERKFSHSFGFKMILSFSFLPHLLLDLLALIPSTTLIIPHGRQDNHSIQRSFIHIRPRGRALTGKPCPCSHGSRLGGRAHRQDTISSPPYAGTEGGDEGHRQGAGRTPGSAEPCRRPLGLPFDATHHQEDLRQEGQVPELRRFCTTDDGDACAEGCLQAPFR